MKKVEKSKSHFFIKFFFSIIILLFIIFLYGYYIEPYNLKVNEIPIYNKKLNSDYNGLKIAHFSDIHYGRTINNEEQLKKIVKEINKLNPDIIIFTGDLFDSKKEAQANEKLITKYFQQINAKLAKYAIIGDYDSKYLSIYNSILENSSFKLLNNASTLIYYKSSTPLNIIGLTDTNNLNELYTNDYFNITLIHEPDLIEKVDNTNLVFAGHSLGGQIKIPFIGGIRKIDGAEKYYEAHYKINNKDLYISSGLGTQDINFRFLNTPSLNLYRLYKS